MAKVYENALAFEWRKAKIPFAQRKYIEMVYEGVKVGKYLADLVVEDRVIVEVKRSKPWMIPIAPKDSTTSGLPDWEPAC